MARKRDIVHHAHGASAGTPAKAASAALRVLVLTHPGSCCGSADFNLGGRTARACRDGIEAELRGWDGGVVVVDGALSDELPRRPSFQGAITGALAAAAAAGLPSARVFACDDELEDWVGEVGRAIAGLRIPQNTAFVVTGAWYWQNDEAGCVNAVRDAIRGMGFRCEVSDHAVRDPNGDPARDAGFDSDEGQDSDGDPAVWKSGP